MAFIDMNSSTRGTVKIMICSVFFSLLSVQPSLALKCEAVTAEEKFYQHDVVFVGELEKGPEEWKASVNFPKRARLRKESIMT